MMVSAEQASFMFSRFRSEIVVIVVTVLLLLSLNYHHHW